MKIERQNLKKFSKSSIFLQRSTISIPPNRHSSQTADLVNTANTANSPVVSNLPVWPTSQFSQLTNCLKPASSANQSIQLITQGLLPHQPNKATLPIWPMHQLSQTCPFGQPVKSAKASYHINQSRPPSQFGVRANCL
jgi:hypothetical protein